MSDGWDDMKRAKEEQYFDKLNKAAVERLKGRIEQTDRMCPVNGVKLQQITVSGVNIDKCPSCNGIWLDAGELEELIKSAKMASTDKQDWISGFFASLFAPK